MTTPNPWEMQGAPVATPVTPNQSNNTTQGPVVPNPWDAPGIVVAPTNNATTQPRGLERFLPFPFSAIHARLERDRVNPDRPQPHYQGDIISDSPLPGFGTSSRILGHGIPIIGNFIGHTPETIAANRDFPLATTGARVLSGTAATAPLAAFAGIHGPANATLNLLTQGGLNTALNVGDNYTSNNPPTTLMGNAPAVLTGFGGAALSRFLGTLISPSGVPRVPGPQPNIPPPNVPANTPNLAGVRRGPNFMQTPPPSNPAPQPNTGFWGNLRQPEAPINPIIPPPPVLGNQRLGHWGGYRNTAESSMNSQANLDRLRLDPLRRAAGDRTERIVENVLIPGAGRIGGAVAGSMYGGPLHTIAGLYLGGVGSDAASRGMHALLATQRGQKYLGNALIGTPQNRAVLDALIGNFHRGVFPNNPSPNNIPTLGN